MFSKQHYEAIAAIIKQSIRSGSPSKDVLGTISAEGLARELCRYFKADNPLFNSKKFWEACFEEVSDVLP